MSRLGCGHIPSYVTDVNREVKKERNQKMKNKEIVKYWENEVGELIEFGNYFMRCFDKAGKLQFGSIYHSKNTGETKYLVKFVLDKESLINSKEGAEYLMQTIDEWRNQEGKDNE